MIAVREFSSGAELRAYAAANHKRFFPTSTSKNIAVQKRIEDMKKDKVRRDALKAAESAPGYVPERKTIVQRKPNEWELFKVYFNEHIIAYRTFLLSQEPRDEVREEFPNRKMVVDIQEEALTLFPGVTLTEIKSQSRVQIIVQARHHAIFEVWRQRPDLSWVSIGKHFGGMDHGSIIYAVRKVAKKFNMEVPARISGKTGSVVSQA